MKQMKDKQYVFGIDFGTDSVRSIIYDTENGDEISGSVFNYPRWNENKYCNPAKNQYRQHPKDYTEGLINSVRDALSKAPANVAKCVKGITIDTTGSTPIAVNKDGIPLAMLSGFEDNPNAMFILWKDHTAIKEAEEITQLAKSWGGEDYTKYSGGIYSSEWFWAKILHVLRTDNKVRSEAFSWVEHCDWMPALLTGNVNPLSIKRSRCAAGHKAMWHATWEGLPSNEFLAKVDPLLDGLRDNLYTKTYTADLPVGNLSGEWAEKLGLSTDVKVGVGIFDAHVGAVGAEIKPSYMSKVMGTSTCDMMVIQLETIKGKLVKGICGQVDGSIIPGLIGLEAGQSAFGDVYAWFEQLLQWPIQSILKNSNELDNPTKEKITEILENNIISELSKAAEKISPDETTILALDWLNGRRTPDANPMVKGAIAGLNMGSDAPGIFRALVEATAFGAKQIVERFIQEGISVEGIVALGGVAKKSSFVMQVVTDVLGMPIKVARCDQACALGSAMYAATVSGIHPNLYAARQAMGNGFEKEYLPIPDNVARYEKTYKKYVELGRFIEHTL